MPQVKFPLSGDVVQSINPWSNFLNGGQFGVVNISLGKSAAPDVERAVLEDVASYGRQLGRVGEALTVLIDHFQPERALTEKEARALAELTAMLEEIAAVKRKQGTGGCD